MKLADLEPKWKAHGDNPRAGLIFKCPCCRTVWLTAKAAPIPTREQFRMYEDESRVSGGQVVTCRADAVWTFAGDDFATLSATPSVDASASGHWHGFITNGECR